MPRPATAAVRLLSGEREPVRAATTANIKLSGLQTVDAIALAVGDRVLVKNQSNPVENGIYDASEGKWFRSSDARFSRAIQEGVTVQSREGAVNAGKAWRFADDNPEIDVDPITIGFYLSANFATDAEQVIGDIKDAAIAEIEHLIPSEVLDALIAAEAAAASAAASAAADREQTGRDVIETAQAALDAAAAAALSGSYDTLAEALAAIGGYVEGQSVEVTDDGEQTGLYARRSGAWVKISDLTIGGLDLRTRWSAGATDPGGGIFRVGNRDGASLIEVDPALGARVFGGYQRSATGLSSSTVMADGAVSESYDPDAGWRVPAGWLRSTDDALFMISQSDGAILWRLNHDGSVDSTGTSSTPVSAGVWGLLMGAPTHQSIRLSFDLINGATLGRVKLYTDPFLTNEVGDYTIRPFASAGRDQNYSTCRLEIAGLKKNTRYHGRAWANERDDLAMDFSFTTFPAPGEARAVKFLVGACFNVDQYPNAKVLAAMAEKADDGALFLLQLGDFPYSDKTEADPALARDVDIRHLLADPALQALAQVMPIIHKFSDHDAAGNNSHWDKIYVSGDSNQAIIRAGLAAAREREPQYERAQYASGEGDPAKLTNAFSFQCGRQLFIAPDEYTQQRYEDGSGNHIGAAAVVLANGVQPNAAEWNQQQWFLDEIDRAESDATISRVWGCFSLLWLQDVFDGWQEHFQTQQTLICEHIRDNLTKAWGAFGGDPHYQGAIDSFDYAQYNVADLAQPCLITGPMAHETTFGESSVAKWRNVSAKATGANSAYYVVDIDDDGEFDWTSCAVDTVTGVETIQAAPTVSSLDYDPKIAFTAGASSAAASTVTQLQIGKDWFGPASPVTVNWSTDNGQSGSVVFASHHRLRTIAVTAPASGSIIVTISITGSRAATGVQATHTLSAI